MNNVPPSVQAGPDQTVDEGGSVELAPATFTDPGLVDTHSATIDWGDGPGPQPMTVAEGGGLPARPGILEAAVLRQGQSACRGRDTARLPGHGGHRFIVFLGGCLHHNPRRGRGGFGCQRAGHATQRRGAAPGGLALNFAHGAVGWDEPIDTGDDQLGVFPFHAVMAEAEAILLDPVASHDQLERAKDLAEAVNKLEQQSSDCDG